MQQWEERGYGQGRKKKKSKDVKKAFEKKLGNARARRQAVRAVAAPARARAGGAQRRRRRAARAARSSSAGRSASARSTSRSRGATASRSSGRTAAARRRCSTRCSAAAARDGARWVGPGVVLGELEQRREPFAGDGRCSTRSSTRAGCRRRTRARCSRSSISAPTTSCARGALALAGRAHARGRSRCSAARGVNCLVLDEPTNHLDVEAIEELERALAGYDGTVLLVTHDRVFLDRFGATRTIEL